MSRTYFVLLLAAIAILNGFASTRAQDAARGMQRGCQAADEAKGAEIKYRKKVALIVGINYHKARSDGPADREREVEPAIATDLSKLDEIPVLKNAESDAMEMHSLLVEKYGFDATDTLCLIGADATQTRIRQELGNLVTKQVITSDDCVLFFFSGHGMALRRTVEKKEHYFLLPSDAQLSGGQPNPGSAIEMDNVVAVLQDCPARHKLLIMDCCHSGAVFRVNGVVNLGGNEEEQSGYDVFASEAFQAIAASRDNQRTSDGRDGHSPFTFALLEALKTLPLQQKRDGIEGNVFTASQLYAFMVPYLKGQYGQNMGSAQRGWLTEHRGEFFFAPDPNATFGEGSVSEPDRKHLLALTPTTFGNWWAYEVPWFMPGLRSAILNQTTVSRSTTDELDRDALLTAAREARHNALTSHLKQVFEMRYRHLDELLSAGEGKKRRQAMRLVVEDIDKKRQEDQTKPEPLLEAEDIHYLAVLQHLLGDSETARATYIEALKRYESTAAKGKSSLQPLCLLDAATLYSAQEEYELAKSHIRKALGAVNGKLPKPFEIYAACLEGDICRREGKFGTSRNKMEVAINLLTQWDPSETTLLSSFTRKTRAWASMEDWDFKRAKSDFDWADKVLNGETLNNRIESSIDRLHIRHGLAMIERFQGRTANSLAQYRKLTPAIAQELRKLENRQDDDLPNYAEIRAMLFERLVNSLDRQADCSLFGELPDYAEAADDYRRALNECNNVSPDLRDEMKLDMLYRRGLATCLSVATRIGKEPIEKCKAEVELARKIHAEAEELRDEDPRKCRTRTRFIRALSAACLCAFSHLDKSGEAAETTALEISRELDKDPTSCDRDELERLMFALKVFIDRRELFGFEPYVSQKHVSRLLSCCRSACRLDLPDPELLTYLRPYYDSAFVAQSELVPGNSKELVEIAWESTRGTPYMKPEVIQPLIVSHVAAGHCYLLVDAPGGNSQAFRLDESDLEKRLISASSNGEFVTLPDGARAMIRKIQNKQPSTKFVLRWHDPVLGIGYEKRTIPETYRNDSIEASKPELSPVVSTALNVDLKPLDPCEFPFSLQGILNATQYKKDDAGVVFKRFKSSANERPAAKDAENALTQSKTVP